MSKNISLDEIKKFWPERAPDISIVQKYVKKYEKEKIVIKYGGNVLIDRNVFNNFISDINVLNRLGFSIIVVHGGGPRIKRELDKKKIVSKFINGLRVTDKNIIDTVEEVLIDFNKDIVGSLKQLGSEATSFHTKTNNIIEVEPEREELGFVGIPNKINDNLKISYGSNIDLKNNFSPFYDIFGLELYDECSRLNIKYSNRRYNDNFNTSPEELISISYYMDYLGFFGYEQKSNVFFEEAGNFNYGN